MLTKFGVCLTGNMSQNLHRKVWDPGHPGASHPRTPLLACRTPKILRDWASSGKSGLSSSSGACFPHSLCCLWHSEHPSPASPCSSIGTHPYCCQMPEATQCTPRAPTVPCLPSWETHTPPLRPGPGPSLSVLHVNKQTNKQINLGVTFVLFPAF